MANKKRHKITTPTTWVERTFFQAYSRRAWFLTIVACFLCILLYQRCVTPVMHIWSIEDAPNLPKSYHIHGIDISHHQKQVDWDKLRNAGLQGFPIRFVMIKATEGARHKDRLFDYNFQKAGEVGMLRGAYHYFKPNVSGKQQAEFFLNTVALEEGDLPPVLDIEEIGKLSISEFHRELKACLDILENRYYTKPIIYTGLNFKKKYLNNPIFDRYPLWLAHYYVPEMKYQGKWHFWQHTDKGKVYGIRGYVDLNVYKSTMYDLQQLTIKY